MFRPTSDARLTDTRSPDLEGGSALPSSATTCVSITPRSQSFRDRARLSQRGLVATALLALMAVSATGGGTSTFVWGAALTAIITELTGPTALALVVLGFVVGGALLMFSRFEAAGMRLIQVMIGGAIVVGAAALATSLGFTGALI